MRFHYRRVARVFSRNASLRPILGFTPSVLYQYGYQVVDDSEPVSVYRLPAEELRSLMVTAAP